MNNKLSSAFLRITFAIMVLFTGCKQDAIIGDRVTETGKVFLRRQIVREQEGSME